MELATDRLAYIQPSAVHAVVARLLLNESSALSMKCSVTDQVRALDFHCATHKMQLDKMHPTAI